MIHEKITPARTHPERPLPSRKVFITADEVLMTHGLFLVEAAREGIQDVAYLVPTSLEIGVLGHTWDAGEYGSTNWFTSRARIKDENGTHQGKLLGEALLRDSKADPNRETSLYLGYMLIGQEMTAAGHDGKALNFIFGVTDKEVGQTIQSVYHFVGADLSPKLMALATRHIARHEFGHLLGLDEGSIKNQDRRGGIYEGHCANECTMQQVVSVSETVDLAARLERKPYAGFCDDCSTYLASIQMD